MKLQSTCLLFVTSLSFVALPSFAQERSASTVEATPSPNKADVVLSNREKHKGFKNEQWRLEHEQIQEIRANRHNPTEKGMWYSTPSREEKVARLFSDGLGPVVAGSLGYLALSGKDGRDAAFDGAKALVVQGVVVTGIKKLIPIRRPYPNDYKFGTFPSGHTSTAFTMAGILGAAKPGAKTPAYVVASLVGWSRVKVRAHRWQDVAAGAVVGIVVANQFKPEKEVRGPFARLNLRF